MGRVFIISLIFFFGGCQFSEKVAKSEQARIKILIDTDANNELDDQHALAYAFLNQDVFDIVGITVNNTYNGDGIQGQYNEALRILQLFNLETKIPLLKGASKSYNEIAPNILNSNFDGFEAVDFIISEALKTKGEKLVVAPIGKLTNITLAILKEPGIIDKIRVVWLGSNYPDSGEYNLENDTTAINPLINSGVEFEMVTVRYGKESGTAAVKVNLSDISKNVKGKGIETSKAINGRHGGEFKKFGDYSLNLFENAEMYGNPPSRSLFDMAAVAIIKNPKWAKKVTIPAPKLNGDIWIEQVSNSTKIAIWEDFDSKAIIKDFYDSLGRSE